MVNRQSPARLGWPGAVVLLAVALLAMWFQPKGAQGGAGPMRFPDAAAQSNQVVAELKRLNVQLAELNKLLTSGDVAVTVRESKAASRRPKGR